MKAKLKIIAFSIALTLCVNAQTYKPFPIDSAIWGFYFIGPTGNNNTKEIIKGDTILGGNTYHKVYSQSNLIVGFYREHSKKIYAKIIGYTDTSEILIYDYNLNVGDTFYDKRATYTTSLVTFNYKFVLTSITTSSLTLDVRKQYNFSYVGQSPVTANSNLGFSCNFYWIEGIGSIKGIFNNRSYIEGTECHIAALISNASTAYLKCFEHKNTEYMPQSCVTLGLKEITSSLNFKIYPNPANDVLNLEINPSTSSGPSSVSKLVITNTLGEFIYSTEFYQSNYTLDLPQIPSGAYIAILYLNNQISYRTKLIKQ